LRFRSLFLAAGLLLAACGAQAGPHDKVILAAGAAPKLSDYGFFKDVSARQPVEGVTPYDLVNALFSDHATKHRLVYVPKGQAARYDPDKVFDFPVGAVLIKTFAFAPDQREPGDGERYVETRVLIHKASGWVAYPYVWNAAQTEALYTPEGGRQSIATISPGGEALQLAYAVPNQNQCKACHQSGHELQPIGPKARNLNHPGPTVAGKVGPNQIAEWTARGILAGAPPSDTAASVPAVFGDGPLDQRARAWLDINCAHCHKADGGASNSGLYLGWTQTDPAGWGVRKRPVAAGRGAGEDYFVIEPGHPEQSILLHRLESTEPGVLMPELGRTVRDERAIKLVSDWIAAMAPAASNP
jgi:uncharacterized repeat protein (TIGR03806 family)